MATELTDIKCFYNHKHYPISLWISRPKNVKYLLNPNQELRSKDGSYVVTEELFTLSKNGLVAYKLKNIVDKMIKTESTEQQTEQTKGTEQSSQLNNDTAIKEQNIVNTKKNVKKLLKKKHG